MDEFDLIHSITPRTIHHSSVDVGIGDDAALYTRKTRRSGNCLC